MIRTIFRNWQGLVFNSRCPLCDRPAATAFCRDCTRQVQACQLPNPEQHWQGELPLLAWGAYQGPLKRAIAVLKYNHQAQLATPLGQWLAQAWLSSITAPPPALGVVPIPLHPGRQQQRGYNQAALLAQSFCDYTGLRLKTQGLQRVQNTQAQFGLSAWERDQNLRGAFSLGKDFRNRLPKNPVLLLDDIYTTGSTLRSATQTLQASGIQVYGGVAVAKARMILATQA